MNFELWTNLSEGSVGWCGWVSTEDPELVRTHLHRYYTHVYSLFVHYLYILNAVKCPYSVCSYVRNAGRGQLRSEWRHNENDVIMRTGAARAGGARGVNDVIMIIAGLWRYGDWRRVATGCNALVYKNIVTKQKLIQKIRRWMHGRWLGPEYSMLPLTVRVVTPS